MKFALTSSIPGIYMLLQKHWLIESKMAAEWVEAILTCFRSQTRFTTELQSNHPKMPTEALSQNHFLHFLLVKASHKASQEARDEKVDLIPWQVSHLNCGVCLGACRCILIMLIIPLIFIVNDIFPQKAKIKLFQRKKIKD